MRVSGSFNIVPAYEAATITNYSQFTPVMSEPRLSISWSLQTDIMTSRGSFSCSDQRMNESVRTCCQRRTQCPPHAYSSRSSKPRYTASGEWPSGTVPDSPFNHVRKVHPRHLYHNPSYGAQILQIFAHPHSITQVQSWAYHDAHSTHSNIDSTPPPVVYAS